MSDQAQKQLDGFVDKYLPAIAKEIRACLKKMRRRLPGATQMVYDNYQALVIGFGPSEKASEAILSIVTAPQWVTLFFLQGAAMPDPGKRLQGNGTVARHIRLTASADLDLPEIDELIGIALNHAKKPIDPQAPGKLVIKSISEKQRPRRPI